MRLSEFIRSEADSVLYRTIDPRSSVEGMPVPALTTLLYDVCQNDPERYEEATRICALFINEALRSAAGDHE